MVRSKLPAAAASADEPGEPALRVLRQFRQVFNAVKTHFQMVEKRAGIGGAQLWALSVIANHPGIGVGALAGAMDIQQSTASNLVKALVERELVKVARDGPDRRAVQLSLLPAAKKLLAKAPGPFSGVLPGALAQLDPKVLRRLEADLAELIAALGPDERAAKTPLADL
jgi:DNA-binding MarR family transcriptional regulator